MRVKNCSNVLCAIHGCKPFSLSLSSAETSYPNSRQNGHAADDLKGENLQSRGFADGGKHATFCALILRPYKYRRI